MEYHDIVMCDATVAVSHIITSKSQEFVRWSIF